EIDWWIVSSGQCDDRRDDSDDVEWESTADEEELTTEAAEPTRLSAATAQDNVEDDAQSESNLSESSLVENEDTVSPVPGRETTPEKEPAQTSPADTSSIVPSGLRTLTAIPIRVSHAESQQHTQLGLYKFNFNIYNYKSWHNDLVFPINGISISL
ncbi:hypothetical protein FRC17_007341, partial [Serendipita sp. 399]